MRAIGTGWGLFLCFVGILACSRQASVGGPSPSKSAGGILLGGSQKVVGPEEGLGKALAEMAGSLVGENAGQAGGVRQRDLLAEASPREKPAPEIAQEKVQGGGGPQARVQPGATKARTPECARAEEDFRLARQARNLDDAVFYYRRGLRLCPNDAGARNDLGELYVSMGRLPEAEGEFRRALEIDPADPRAQKNLDRVASRR